MIRLLLFDAGPLGRIAHPRPNAEFLAWFDSLLDAGVVIVHPEVADYEVRRSLPLAGLGDSLRRLDELKQTLLYQPITTATMLRAAELWAQSRKRGRTTADPKELNGDVILAAQALEAGGTVLTDNVGHLAQFVEAVTWKEYRP